MRKHQYGEDTPHEGWCCGNPGISPVAGDALHGRRRRDAQPASATLMPRIAGASATCAAALASALLVAACGLAPLAPEPG